MLESVEKLGQALGNAEKEGATKEIQLAEEGGSLLKPARARKYFQSHFSNNNCYNIQLVSNHYKTMYNIILKSFLPFIYCLDIL